MKIYTKTGDLGQTSLFSGGRVSKDHCRVQIYGTLDETNSLLGLALSYLKSTDTVNAKILKLQNELFLLGAELATEDLTKLKLNLISDSNILALENEIDEMQSELAPLKNFILPGGTSAASAIHVARTVARRAERELVAVMAQIQVRPEVLRYMNRLSDYLFILGRYTNFKAGVQDALWI